MSIKQKLREARKIQGISQEQMAKLTNMEQTTYSKKERGLSRINDKEWELFAKVLNVNEEDIKESEPVSFHTENCTFSDNSICNQYVTIPEDAYIYMKKYIELLEKQANN